MSTTFAPTRTGRRTTAAALVLESVVDRFGIAPVVLQEGEVRIGSRPDSDVVVPGPETTADSRECIVSTIGGETRVLAGDARLWLNNVPIDEARLRAGDRLAFGAVEFRVRRATPEEVAAEPERPTAVAEPTPEPVAPPIVEVTDPTPPADPEQSLREHLVDVDEAIRREQDRLADALVDGVNLTDVPPPADEPTPTLPVPTLPVAEAEASVVREPVDTKAIERRVHLMGELLEELQATVDENLELPDPVETREREDRLDRVEARLLDRERELASELERLDEQREELARVDRELESRERAFETHQLDLGHRDEEHDETRRRFEAERTELDQRSMALTGRRREADRRDEALNARQRELDESANRLDERALHLDDRDAELRDRSRDLEDRQRRFEDREHQLDRRERSLEEQREEVARERGLVDEETAALADRRRDADRRDEALNARQTELDESAARLDERTGLFEDREAELRERDREFDERARSLDDREHQLDRRDRSLDEDRDALARERESFETEREEARERRRERDSDLQDQRAGLDERTRTLTEAERELDAERAKLAERSHEVDESAARLRSERSRFEEERGRHESVVAEIEERRLELDRRERDLDERWTALDTGREEFETERRDLRLEEQRLADERADVDAQRADVEAEQRRLDERRNELTALEVAFDQRPESDNDAVSTEADVDRDPAVETEAESEAEAGLTQEDVEAAVSAAVEAVRAEVADAERGWDEERGKLTAEVASLESQLSERNEDLAAERERLEDDRRTLEAEREAINRELADEWAELEELRTSIERESKSTDDTVTPDIDEAAAETSAEAEDEEFGCGWETEPIDGVVPARDVTSDGSTLVFDATNDTVDTPEAEAPTDVVDPFAPTQLIDGAAIVDGSLDFAPTVDPFGTTELVDGPSLLAAVADPEPASAASDGSDDGGEPHELDPFGRIAGVVPAGVDPFAAPDDEEGTADSVAVEPTNAEATLEDDVAFDFTDDEAPAARDPFAGTDWTEGGSEPAPADPFRDARPSDDPAADEAVDDRGEEGVPEPLAELPIDALTADDAGEDAEVQALRSSLAAMFDMPPMEGPGSPAAATEEVPTSEEPEADDVGLPMELPSLDAAPEPELPAEPADDDSADEEDSVQAYMARLLARTRGNREDGAPTPAVRKPEPAPEPPKAEPVETAPVAEIPAGPPPEPKYRQDHAAVRANIDSLREVANLSARTAIASYTWKQLKGTILAKGTLLLVFVVLSAVLLSSPWWSNKEYGISGWIALAAAIVMGWELRRSVHLLYQHGDEEMLAEDRTEEAEAPVDPMDRLDAELND